MGLPLHSDAARPADAADWVLHMRWHDLLFAHWPVPADVVQRALPWPLEVATFDGSAWIGVVPFRMTEVRLRRLPLPFANRFCEVNVRTYVRHGDHEGVHFLSLDAESPIAVLAARIGMSLPYYPASMSLANVGVEVRFASRRIRPLQPPGEIRATYVPIGDPFETVPGTLDHWLTERHALLAVDRDGGVVRVRLDHVPWPLQEARATFDVETLVHASGILLPGREPLLHFCRDLEVVALAPERLG